MGFALPVSSRRALAGIHDPTESSLVWFFPREMGDMGDEGAWANSFEGSLTLPVPWGSQWLCGEGCCHLACLQAWQLHPSPCQWVLWVLEGSALPFLEPSNSHGHCWHSHCNKGTEGWGGRDASQGACGSFPCQV